MTLIILISLLLLALTLSIYSAFMVTRLYIASEAKARSTHQVQLVPVDQLQDFKMDDGYPSITDEQKKVLTKDPFEELS
jgi:hypothetical protein